MNRIGTNARLSQRLLSLAVLGLIPLSAEAGSVPAGGAGEPLRILGTNLGDTSVSHGGLPPAVGVASYQVMRASRRHPELSDGFGYTYHHSPDLLFWNERFHVAWKSNPKDEDVPPGHILWTTSRNGVDWEFPRLLFPTIEVGDGRATEWGARSYLRLASNGRLLAVAGFRDEVVVAFAVREIHRDGRFGPIYWIFRDPERATRAHDGLLPVYTESGDLGFVAACQETLRDRLFLEQAYDYGRFLERDKRMPWHERLNPEKRFGFGKAFSFCTRPDGAILAVAKLAWATLSFDAGETWTKPVQPKTLNVSRSKIWAQRTSDSRYALVYDPVTPGDSPRWPLVIVTGEDGVEFRDMRTVHEEVPRRRYLGLHKNMGPQYVRGIWPPNGGPPDDDLWLVYSVNKEDIWVSRVPVPVRTDAVGAVDDDFETSGADGLAPAWNVYSPLWAPVRVVRVPEGQNRALQLEDRDPYDSARVTRLFGSRGKARISFRVMADPDRGGRLEAEVVGPNRLPAVRLAWEADGRLTLDGEIAWMNVGRYSASRWVSVEIHADVETQRHSLSIDGKMVLPDARFAHRVDSLEGLTFRTGSMESWIPPPGEDSKYWDVSVEESTDHSIDTSTYYVDEVRVR